MGAAKNHKKRFTPSGETSSSGRISLKFTPRWSHLLLHFCLS